MGKLDHISDGVTYIYIHIYNVPYNAQGSSRYHVVFNCALAVSLTRSTFSETVSKEQYFKILPLCSGLELKSTTTTFPVCSGISGFLPLITVKLLCFQFRSHQFSLSCRLGVPLQLYCDQYSFILCYYLKLCFYCDTDIHL